ncbi:protein of unknown function [Pseudomonas mediterranea]
MRIGDRRKSPVGASLLAKRRYFKHRHRLTYRIREQACSHIFLRRLRIGDRRKSPVGASLLAMAI